MSLRPRTLTRNLFIMLLLGAALSAGLYVGSRPDSNAQPAAAVSGPIAQTTTLTPPGDNGFGGDFELQSPQGPLALRALRGQVVVLMFGYASCPDVCPTGLANVAAALDQLDQGELAQVQPLFISVDPERDTLERLAEYAPYFHPKIIGLTGELEQLSQVALSYGAFFRKVPMQDSALGYAVDHTARIYLLGRTGQLRALMEHNVTPSTLAKALRQLLAQPAG